jgi:NAD(P)-dependent dehydrogenase (short-subunit alcohol dehydrogenase family)
MKGLTGKVAIVTGGASGIGAAACRRFIQEGARVAIGDIDGDRAHALAKELGKDAIGVRFDAGDVAQIENLVSKTVATFGRLDFLFNNAAIMTHEVVIKDTNPVDIEFDTWDLVQRVNVRGYLAGCKFAIPHMLKTGGGSIVMTASGSGIRGDISNIAYGCSKAAIICMAMYVATQYGKQGIRCNAINPGLIRTEGGKKNVHGPILDIVTRNHLTPYVGQPEDIAANAAYLCSEDGRFITGQAINVDGGINAHMPYYAEMQNLNVKWDIPLTPGAESAA